MSILEWVDRLAGRWLDWRMEQVVKSDPEIAEMGLKRTESRHDGSGWDATLITPAAAYIAGEMAALLNQASAENYVQFDMMPRLDRGMRPVRVTVQWANGESPAAKAARLERELYRALYMAGFAEEV